MAPSRSDERFEAKDLLTILGVLALGAIGYCYDQRVEGFGWLLSSFGRLWLAVYVGLAGVCLYCAIRYRTAGWWWGIALGVYLLLMPWVTMWAASVYSAFVAGTPASP